jgi:hypothetical protein
MQNCTLVYFERKAKEVSNSYKEHITDTKKEEINYVKNILDKGYKHD